MSTSAVLLDRRQHQQVFAITIPMTLAGLSTPLLGMVDTAVMGHLDAAYYLGAVAIGALVFSFLFWGFGFLRMGVTGLTAQAFGEGNDAEIAGGVIRGIFLAVFIGFALIALQELIVRTSLLFLDATENIENNLRIYLEIRILSAPAALVNYVLLGWFLGIQKPRYTLYLLLLVNVVNIFLDLLFVVSWQWRVEGVAWASVWAEYIGLLCGLFLVFTYITKKSIAWNFKDNLQLSRFKKLIRVSGNIMIRTLCLIGSFAFFTLQGAKFGEATLAANAVLMNFQTFMAHGLDGFAHAAEALVGRYLGKKNYNALKDAIVVCTFWSFIVAIAFALFYWLFGEMIIALLTDISAVSDTARVYLPWAIVAPLISVWGYLFDGIFVGAAWSAAMRNTMLISTSIFILAWWASQSMGNHGLWLALMVFMLARGLTMAMVYRQKRKDFS